MECACVQGFLPDAILFSFRRHPKLIDKMKLRDIVTIYSLVRSADASDVAMRIQSSGGIVENLLLYAVYF
jgi:hypothetical protein